MAELPRPVPRSFARLRCRLVVAFIGLVGVLTLQGCGPDKDATKESKSKEREREKEKEQKNEKLIKTVDPQDVRVASIRAGASKKKSEKPDKEKQESIFFEQASVKATSLAKAKADPEQIFLGAPEGDLDRANTPEEKEERQKKADPPGKANVLRENKQGFGGHIAADDNMYEGHREYVGNGQKAWWG